MSERGDSDPGDGVVELEFAVTDPAYPFVGASAAEQCRVELEEMVPRDDGEYAEFFSVSGADPASILSLATQHESVSPELVREYEDGGLFEFSVVDDCPAVTLAEQGALPRTVRGVRGEGTIIGELPAGSDPGAVVEAFLEEYPAAEFVAKRETDRSAAPLNYDGLRRVVRERLTDRQYEVLETAFEAGYYDWPRECTGQEVAETLGITSATFSQHVHAAERKLLATLFEPSTADARNRGRSDDS
ncbi:helix-turn-helix domain-containing protein [Halorussus halobius]|uniref:helix-turn-helix domain-containing protein n=1 Tax=Halorussus halobius TaxID=1710537 RepID=UPI001092A83E|nr:bacterio-opsin activator domain-containing protein [Halorussus halobius]